MIWAVKCKDVEDYLGTIGFKLVSTTQYNLIFRNGQAFLTMVKPGISGLLPMMYVDAAFDAAGVAVPNFNQCWCD